MQARNRLTWKWLLISIASLCLITLFTYSPGLSGDYEFDDTVNIIQNSSLKLDELSVENLYRSAGSGGYAGPLKRPISMMTFAVNIYFTGFNPFYMKLTNILIHCINGASIFILTALLLIAYTRKTNQQISMQHIYWTALAITFAWTLHPLALTSVLYIVQRMTSLSALFTIWGLITYTWARLRMLEGKHGLLILVAGLFIFGVLSVFSKENGVLLPFFTLVIEWTFFGFQSKTPQSKRWLYSLYIVTVALPVVFLLGWLVTNPDWLFNGYQIRSFNVHERLLTEARVFWFYIYLILLPNISAMGIYHDDLQISQDLFTPWSTLPSLLVLLIIISVTIYKRKSIPVIAFGIFFFIAGHLLESTILPLELAHEHRNYLPMYGILFTAFFYLLHPSHQPRLMVKRYAFAVLLVALLGASTFIRATYWGSLLEHSLVEVKNHPMSPRTQFQAGRIYWKLAFASPENRDHFLQLAREHFEHTYQLSNIKNEAIFALIHLSYFADFKLEPNWIPELIDSLTNKPLPSSTINVLQTYTNCQNNNICKLDHETMTNIYSAILSNPTLKGRSRASVLSLSALYAANQGEYEKAINLLHLATKDASGDLNFRLTLIDLLIKTNHVEEAQRQIKIIKTEDSLASYTESIKRKEIMLHEYERKAGQNIGQ